MAIFRKKIEESTPDKQEATPAAASEQAVAPASPDTDAKTLPPVSDIKLLPPEKSKGFMQPQKSKGEEWFDKRLYRDVGYTANLILSLFAIDYFTHGRGKPGFEKNLANLNGFFKKIGVAGLVGEKATERATRVAVETFSINAGGNVVLLPTWIAENHKAEIVHHVNKHKFHDPQLGPDGKEQTPEEIYLEKEQTKTSLGNILLRRVGAMSLTMVSGVLLDLGLRKHFPQPQMVNGKMVSHIDGRERYTGVVVNGANKVLNSGVVPFGKSIAATPWIQRVIGYLALDTFFTAETSLTMFLTRGRADKKAKKHEGLQDDALLGALGNDQIVAIPDAKQTMDPATAPSVTAKTWQERTAAGADADKDKNAKEKDCKPCTLKRLEKLKQKRIPVSENHTDMLRAGAPAFAPAL